MQKPQTERAAPSKLADVLVLAKVRLNALVVATTAGGYYMAAGSQASVTSLAVAAVGTALVASGAAAINQVAERDTDRLMIRTRQRPVAAGRMSAVEGHLIGWALTAVGCVTLWFLANPLSAGMAIATLVTYIWAYTPMKRHTSLATIVGAVPGALPPLIGWAAARGSIDELAPWTLFIVMFLWQLPHFLAIAWLFREDYARAGLPMLPVVDTDGSLTGRQAVLWAAALVPLGVLPYFVGLADARYAVGSIVLGVLQLVVAIRFAQHRSEVNARRLFYASITYLPLLWALMAVGRR